MSYMSFGLPNYLGEIDDSKVESIKNDLYSLYPEIPMNSQQKDDFYFNLIVLVVEKDRVELDPVVVQRGYEELMDTSSLREVINVLDSFVSGLKDSGAENTSRGLEQYLTIAYANMPDESASSGSPSGSNGSSGSNTPTPSSQPPMPKPPSNINWSYAFAIGLPIGIYLLKKNKVI